MLMTTCSRSAWRNVEVSGVTHQGAWAMSSGIVVPTVPPASTSPCSPQTMPSEPIPHSLPGWVRRNGIAPSSIAA